MFVFFILRSHVYNESIDQMQYVFPQSRPGIKCKGFCRLHVAFNVLYHYPKPCWNVRPAAVQLGQGMRNDTTAPNMPFAHSVAVIRHGMQKPCFFHSICPVQFGQTWTRFNYSRFPPSPVLVSPMYTRGLSISVYPSIQFILLFQFN